MHLAQRDHWPKLAHWAAWPIVAAVWFLASPATKAQPPDGTADAAKPLHQRIDELVDAGQIGPTATAATDAEFLRRVYLDLVGTIPTAAEARAFLDDTAADKRPKLIARLLASPEHARHLATWFDVMLMERRPAKGVADAEWRKFLFDSIRANKPYDQLVREILTSDGSDAATRPAANFLLARDAEPNVVTRDVGRIFFGRDLQCCQCHDHPLVDDYYQDEYYGIFALVGRTSVFVDKKDKDKQYLAEKADGDPKFVSVFDKAKIERQGQPRVPLGEPIADPQIAPGEEYAVKPDKEVRGVPKYSRRAALAKAATENNSAFQRNIVNRLWAMLFGEGLVDPVDMHNRANPPANEAVLDLLATEFAAHEYDVRWLLGELVQSRTYQRSIDLPAELASAAANLSAQIAADEAEREKLVLVAVASKEVVTKIEGEIEAAKDVLVAINAELAPLQAAATAAKKPADEAAAALAAAEKDFAAKMEAAKPLSEAAAKAAEAAAKLADQKDVVDAAATLKAASERQAAAVAAAQKALDDRKAVAKTTSDALVAANAQVAAVSSRAAEATAEVDRSFAGFREATAKWQLDDAAADRLARRAADAKTLVEFVRSHDQIAAAQANVAEVVAELAAANQKAEASAARVTAMTSAVAEAEKATAAAKTAQSQVESQVSELQTTAAALAEAFSKTDAARQRLPDDAELAETTAKLKARAEQAAAVVTAEQPKLAAVQAATATAAEQQTAAVAAMQGAQSEADALKQIAVDASKRAAELEAQRDAVEQAQAELERELASRLTRRLALGGVRALSPEQMAWSMMQASGLAENQRVAEAAEWEKANPAGDAAADDEAAAAAAERIAAREQAVEQTAFDKLVGNVGPFIPLFAAAAGQPQDDFYATADQALFFANGGHVRGWLAPSGENLTARLAKIAESRPLTEELYLSVLTRMPSDAEVAAVESYLAARPNDRGAALQEIAWSLLASAEFRFNH